MSERINDLKQEMRFDGGKDDLSLAKFLADRADEITLDRFLAQDLMVESKPDSTPVTDADRAVENIIREILKKYRPDDQIIGEEYGGVELLENSDKPGRFWIIDPIDGTKNFLRGVPIWATLIALVQRGDSGGVSSSPEILLGVVSSPALGRRWSAQSGEGAFVTETFNPKAARAIAVSKVGELSDACLSYSDLIGWGARREKFLQILDSLWRTRGHGDFYSHMLVAEGAVDIAVEPSLALWDMAALSIIVTEAGGHFSSLDGVAGPFGKSGLSSNGILHHQFLQQLG
ncbi:MAG: histidinol phosphatase [Actinobacteria bacterium]|nr:histidinol phosphatase [Actinomycetota bacterium]MDA2984385.1 histidinol phosphatase [Actinomycetota bacterium]